MARRTRVLHVVQNLNYGGMERMIAEIARRADAIRFESHVMALGYLGHFSQGLDAFATVHLMRPSSGLSGKLSMLRPAALARQIREIAPDVVHTHSGVWYKVSLAARRADVPVLVHTDHGRRIPDPWTYRMIDRIASRRTDAIIAVSDALADHMKSFVADPARLHVIRNGVDTDRYAPSGSALNASAPATGTLRQELGIGPDVPILGSVGRLEPVKGYEVSVGAMAALRRDWTSHAGPMPKLVLIGDGSQRGALETMARDLGVADDIAFLGWRTDIEPALQEFTLFTMSSHSEGTSVSLLEAMSSGLCPVVTDVGGNAVALGDELQHRLVPPASPEALAAAWREALTNPALRARDRAAARRRVCATFGLDAMVREYEALYDTLTKQRDLSARPLVAAS